MFTKKLGGSVVAITAVFAFSPVLAADTECQDMANYVAGQIESAAPQLICERDVGGKYHGSPFWQWGKGKKQDPVDPLSGCQVHLTLGQQLNVPFDQNEPPVTKNGKGQSQSTAKGAAAALRDGKYEDALLNLNNFITTIDSDPTTDALEPSAAKLNPEYVQMFDYYPATAEEGAKETRNWAYNPLTGKGWKTEVAAIVEKCVPGATL